MKEGTVLWSPLTLLPQSTMMTYWLFWWYCIAGEHSSRGETPVERLDWYREYPMKIVVFRYNAEIVAPPFLQAG
jgi:hypothetical protein